MAKVRVEREEFVKFVLALKPPENHGQQVSLSDCSMMQYADPTRPGMLCALAVYPKPPRGGKVQPQYYLYR